MNPTANRRLFLRASAAVAAGAALPSAFAEGGFPSRTVTIVVPSAAGGGLDIIARRLAQKLAEEWKTSVIVETKAGGVGTIGTGAVVRSKPDGHTILLINTPLVQVPWLMQLPFDPMKDLAPVAQITTTFSMLAVHKSSPVNTLEEFIAMVKAAPGKYSYGSWGQGTSTHLYGLMLAKQAGLDMIHVPYIGAAPMTNALIAGHISAAFVDPVTSKVHMNSIKLLASVGTARMPETPSLPTLKEKGFQNFESLGWVGLLVPSGTPPAIVSKISSDIVRLLGQPELAASFEALNFPARPATAVEFAETMRRDYAVWGKVIKENGVTANN